MELNYKIFDGVKEKFELHISHDKNERILFSGKFGVGKSTFLRHYFEENESYNCIHLYPVNYSVLSNEDIFTYLKYDILFDLIVDKQVNLQESKSYGAFEALPFFMKAKWFSFISLIPLAIDKIGTVPGKNVNGIFEGIGKLIEDYKKFANPQDEDVDIWQLFNTNINNREGGIYESNALTEIIKTELFKLKGENNDKKNLLIIDDLDRLDPDHIFRLLNVFSAHFDERNKTIDFDLENKFGFDKVLLVCDIENVRNIFKAKYGMDTDFNGYIDKFYSKEIFEMKMADLIEVAKIQALKSLNIGHIVYSIGDDKFTFNNLFNKIIEILVIQNLINFRNLIRFKNEDIDLSYKNDDVRTGVKISKYSFVTLTLFDILSYIFGDKEAVKIVFNKINSYEIIDDLEQQDNGVIFGELLYLLGKRRSQLVIGAGGTSNIDIVYLGNSYKVYYRKYGDRSIGFSIAFEDVPNIGLNIFEMMKEYVLTKY